MSPLYDESPAFQQALLKSERLRIFILFIAVGVALLFRLIRMLIAWNPDNASAMLWLAIFAAVLVLFDLLVFDAVSRAIASGTALAHPARNSLAASVWKTAFVRTATNPQPKSSLPFSRMCFALQAGHRKRMTSRPS